MEPYYDDGTVRLYQGDALEVLPLLALDGPTHLLTDPPYFKVKNEEWDNQWDKAAEFLDWMGEWLTLARPHLSANASVWVFASPQLTSAVESVVARQFRVLNSVRWVKEQGWHKKADLASVRSFLSPWEGVIFAEQFDDAYDDSALALNRQVFAPFGRYLQSEWERAGWKAGRLGVALGYDSALPVRWAEGSSMPTEDAYQRIRELLGPGYLDREYADLRREHEDLRRPFNVTTRDRSTDVWFFDNVAPYPGKHPCEKPAGLLTHMIETTTRPGDTIIDCFAGSGAVLDAARSLGRRAVGIEKDPHWCQQIANRLSQDVLDFGIA